MNRPSLSLFLLLAGILPAAAAKFPDSLNVTRTRNVFDSTRQAAAPGSHHTYVPTVSVRQDTLRLCGIWGTDGTIVAISENGSGTTAQLQTGGMIGTWKVESVSLKEVLLTDGTVRLHWRPGASLIRPEGGKWTLAEGDIAPAVVSSAPSASSTAEPGKRSICGRST